MTLIFVAPEPDKNWKPPIPEQIRGTESRLQPIPFLPPPLESFLKDGDTYVPWELDVPPDADFEPFRDKHGEPTVHVYWEPYNPGLEIQLYARVQSVAASVEGQWVCRCKAEEDAVLVRFKQFGGDPEKFRLSAQDIRDMMDPEKVTGCSTCSFKTTSTMMWNYHKGWWKHQ